MDDVSDREHTLSQTMDMAERKSSGISLVFYTLADEENTKTAKVCGYFGRIFVPCTFFLFFYCCPLKVKKKKIAPSSQICSRNLLVQISKSICDILCFIIY